MVTIGVFAGRIGSWGLAFLLLFQEGIELLPCPDGIGMIIAKHLTDSLQRLAQKRFGFGEFPLGLEVAGQVVD